MRFFSVVFLPMVLLLVCLVSCRLPIAKSAAFESDYLRIERISDHVYRHESYLETDRYGRVPCNGIVVVDGRDAILFDTPTTDEATLQLLRWVQRETGRPLKAAVATHFHNDCLAGLPVLHKLDIPTYGSERTIELARAVGHVPPRQSFRDSLRLRVEDTDVLTTWPGAGHTKDNVVAYVPADKVLFGGCLVKAKGAGTGNLDDADKAAWPTTVRAVKALHPDIKIVVPGHGKPGGAELIEYTIDLFSAD